MDQWNAPQYPQRPQRPQQPNQGPIYLGQQLPTHPGGQVDGPRHDPSWDRANQPTLEAKRTPLWKRTLFVIGILAGGFLCYCLLSLLGLFQPAGVEPQSGEATQAEVKATGATEGSKEEETIPDEFSVDIRNARLTTDYQGKPCVVITYVFENVSHEQPVCMAATLYPGVYQGDIECDMAISNPGSNWRAGGSLDEVRKGSSVEVTYAYVLSNTSRDVYVRVALLSDTDKVLAHRTFKIDELK